MLSAGVLDTPFNQIGIVSHGEFLIKPSLNYIKIEGGGQGSKAFVVIQRNITTSGTTACQVRVAFQA